MKKNILITGGAGYIGSMLVTKLVAEKHNVTILDNFEYTKDSLNHLYFYKNFKVIEGDVRDKSLIKKLIRNQNFIIPLAALVGAPLCEKNKKKAIDVNFNSILTILRNVKKDQKIIFPTSNSGYGIGEKNKYCDENSPLNPISLYGKTKADAETEILKHKNSVCYRLATVFGYSYRMRTDLLVNNFVLNAVRKKQLTIFEPHFRRNFIHVNDIVNAMIFTINNFQKLRSNVFNLGLSSANISKLMLAKKIKKYVKNLKIQIVHNKKDPDQRDYFVSNKKIEKKGFKACVSLEQGINEMVEIFSRSKTEIKNNY